MPNRNPRLTALEIDGEPTTDATPISVKPGAELEFVPIFNEDANLETYPVVRFPLEKGGELGFRLLTEALEFEFYTTGGAFQSLELSTYDPFEKDPELENTWTAPDEPEEVTVWVIVRDDRGGAAWEERVLRVER